MTGSNAIATHYAVGIGIDNYPQKPLKGAVRDVLDAGAYLKSVLDGAMELRILTASQTDHDVSESIMCRPTRDNVILALQEVRSRARAGDFVYVHYSGHGTRKPPSGEFSDQDAGDLALVLVNEKQDKMQYLWGFELATCLQRMVDNGLVVTLVLDCCFAGSVYRREDPGLRFIAYDADIAAQYPSTGVNAITGYTGRRDASMSPNWLVDPDRYTILTACGPREVAIEPNFDGIKHGALSYFLIKVLKEVGLRMRHQDIYNHICAKVRVSKLPQNPVLYGNRRHPFFGPAESDITVASAAVIVLPNGNIELQAGCAQGVVLGDQFLLRSLGLADGDQRLGENVVTAKVTKVSAFNSSLVPLELLPAAFHVRTGWVATALSRLALRGMRARLSSSLSNHHEWLTKLMDRSIYAQFETREPATEFDVMLNGDGNFIILDESGNSIINLPTMTQKHTSTDQVCVILEHLAQYRLTRDICHNERSSHAFRDSFKVNMSYMGSTYSSDCTIQMKHNDLADLVIENRGDEAIYVSVYNLGPYWQVENAYRGSYVVVAAKIGQTTPRRVRKKLRMMMPDRMREERHQFCRDIVKVFVCSQPTCFDLLELPKIGETPKKVQSSSMSLMRNSMDASIDASGEWAVIQFTLHVSV